MSRLINIELGKWMTPRDRQIIVSVYHHGILNSKQIEYIFFDGNKNSRIIALRRLKKLVDNKFLKQHWYGYNNRASMQHFTITNKGAIIVSSELDIEISEIKVNDAGIISNIEHTSLIADFHVNLLRTGFMIPQFTSERLNSVEFHFMGHDYKLEPDGKGYIFSPYSGRFYPFFLEMDRGTMSYEYFKLKIPKYEAYYASSKYKSEFETFPLVFIITTDNTRLQRLKDLILKTKRSDINYLITTIEDSIKPRDEIFHLIGTNRIIGIN